MEFQWAKVFEPEDSMEAGKPRAWSIDGILDMNDPAALQFVTFLETEFQTLNGAGSKVDKNGWPFKDELDANGQGTGRVIFRFKRNETTQKGKTLPPPVIVDAKRQRWPDDQLIGNGTKGKIAFDPYGWDSPTVRGAKGLSLWLNMVQVIDFKPYIKATAEDVFAEEEGYTAPAATETPFADEAPARPLSMAERMAQRAGGQAVGRTIRPETPPIHGGPSEEEIPF
jgi:hypothetical protein